jgi:hypothetical protein
MSVQVARSSPVPQRAVSDTPRASWWRLDGFELCVLVAFALVSLWVLALDVRQVIVHHLVWTGADGEFLADQMQYLAWIQDSSKHFLASNLFVLRSTPHDYFQPIVVVSAALTRLGVVAWLSLLLWKPVALLAIFFAVRAYGRRMLRERFDRRAALVLALFFGSWGLLGDEWVPFLTWGYPFALLAIAALIGALLAYDRARAEGRITWVAPLLGLFASLTHPWQGEILILTVVGAEAFRWRRPENLRRWLALPALTLAATALPLLYYEALRKLDENWRYAQAASKQAYSLSGILLPLLPLLIAAALAYRRRPGTFIGAATRAWPLAALVIFGFSQTGLAGAPLHAFNGITIPLAILAVEGVQQLGFRRLPRWRLIGVAVVAAATIPASVSTISLANSWVRPYSYRATFIPRGERSAFHYLADNRDAGGVLARATYVGLVVPAETGRRTYVGTCLWSQPHCDQRVVATANLFNGALSAAQARAFVRSTGARFLLEDCYSHANLTKLLGPLVLAERRFGCAAVYEVKARDS